MKKTYETTFKMKVVNEYLKGMEGYKLLAKKYGIPDHSQIRKWVNQYQQKGIQAFEKKHTKKSYTGAFKLEVLHYMKTTGASLKKRAITLASVSHRSLVHGRKSSRKAASKPYPGGKDGHPQWTKTEASL